MVRELSLEAVEFLSGEAAGRELEALATGGLEPLATLQRLRRRWGEDEAAWLFDQARLRRRAAAKFPAAARMLFEAEALEQASSWPVARWRARRFFAPWRRVADLGAGIGGDALALAEAGKRVLAVERDPVRAALLRYNAAALGLAERLEVVVGDWRGLDLRLPAFADPARRRRGRRSVRLGEMEPPLADLLALAERVPALLVKLAPALDKAELPAGAAAGFVSLGGELKEALLGLGGLASPQPWAEVLPAGVGLRGPEAAAPLAPPSGYLYEPDPAVIRAGLVGRLALELGAALLAERVAYLTAPACRPSPLAGCWRILRHGPYRLKELRRWLRELDARSVNVKRRHSPVEPAELAAALPRGGAGPEATVFLTRLRGRPWMLLAVAAG